MFATQLVTKQSRLHPNPLWLRMMPEIRVIWLRGGALANRFIITQAPTSSD
jgi:hypothetical protein